MNKICSNPQCDNIATQKQGTAMYCIICHRLSRMKRSIKERGRKCPFNRYQDLRKLIPSNMLCPNCNKKMIWSTYLGLLKDVICLTFVDSDFIMMCHSCSGIVHNHTLKGKCFELLNESVCCPICKQIFLIKEINHFVDTTGYCNKCYVMRRMRQKAKKDNKYVPSFQQLNNIVPKDMKCLRCKRLMKWGGGQINRSNSISLQHNHDNSILLICSACNAGHGRSYLGDQYLYIDINQKYCPKCKKILNRNNFYRNKAKGDGLCVYCKQCEKKRKSYG